MLRVATPCPRKSVLSKKFTSELKNCLLFQNAVGSNPLPDGLGGGDCTTVYPEIGEKSKNGPVPPSGVGEDSLSFASLLPNSCVESINTKLIRVATACSYK